MKNQSCLNKKKLRQLNYLAKLCIYMKFGRTSFKIGQFAYKWFYRTFCLIPLSKNSTCKCLCDFHRILWIALSRYSTIIMVNPSPKQNVFYNQKCWKLVMYMAIIWHEIPTFAFFFKARNSLCPKLPSREIGWKLIWNSNSCFEFQ